MLQVLRGGSSGGFGRGEAGRGYQVLQALTGSGRENFRENAKRKFQPQQSYPSQQEMTQPGQYFVFTQSAQYGAVGKQNVANVKTVVTQTCYTVQQIIKNACTVVVRVTLKKCCRLARTN